jgi:hypothetical protein
MISSSHVSDRGQWLLLLQKARTAANKAAFEDARAAATQALIDQMPPHIRAKLEGAQGAADKANAELSVRMKCH